jgi:hypothetical protein
MREDANWEARKFLDKTIKDQVQHEIHKLALAVLGNHKLTITKAKDDKGFDKYTYCQHSTKTYCPVGNRNWRYMGRFREYVVYGTTKTDIYLEVLKLLANDSSVYYPITSFNYNNEESV